MRKVVVVTGANSGIGLAFCECLLSHNDQIRLCLACRNLQRAEAACSALLSSHLSADVRVLLVDVTSVVQAAKELKERNVINMFATAEGILSQKDRATADGLQEVFETNVFGHFMLCLYFSVVCPDLVMTNLTYGILPSFFWTLIMPIMWLIRVITNSFTISTFNEAEALMWLFNQKAESLDPLSKYNSCTSGLGNNYVHLTKMAVDERSGDLLFQKMLELEKEILQKCISEHRNS
ncbi:hypothetical protein XELAEV_18023609mg [Xenopus laevis]|uniref:Uncharacterized protein n=1 Tax=Xenopus laevis TaxID=8355 RepID=A0A974HP84_XENLA|nr:hypothetical protein XELAEV_18023609mg [Xenopus laevis]